MVEKLIHQHGGDLDAIEKKYGISKKEIIDFSGNINPLGFPPNVKKDLAENLDLVSVYPDRNYLSLKKSIGSYTCADTSHIVVGNGSTELISTFIKTVNASKTLILGPAYSEYEREASLAGGTFSYFPLEEKNDFVIDLNKLLSALTADIGLFIACNPNNPTGTCISKNQMEVILNHCKKNDTYVMIDETYIEFSDNIDEICSIPLVEKYDNIFIIRGISKFFSAPGIRLGYGICSNKKFLEKLKSVQDPWSVNILAAFAGEKLFSEKNFINNTKKLISDERIRIFDELKNWKNIKAYNSGSNFILLKLLTNKVHAFEIFERLIVKKILIRDASSFTFLDDSYLRFCILMPNQNIMLLDELKKIIEE